MELPDDILERTPEEAARRVSLRLLEQARAATTRLDDPEDAEALHDFRVAIRRLRSTLRAWRPHLSEAITKKDRRSLRALQNATGGGRDAEVLLVWLEPQGDTLDEAQRVGHRWLVERLRERRDAAYATVREDVRRDFARIDQRLTKHLATMRVELDLTQPSAGESYAEALAERAVQHAHEVRDHLAHVSSTEDDEEAHEARISCKRLRYLVEPVRTWSPEARDIVKKCKRLQDVLGDLHDAAVMNGELREAIQEAAVDRARRLHELANEDADGTALAGEGQQDERTGLVELTRRCRARIESLFGELEAEWLGEGAEALVREVDGLAASLRRALRQDVEIERKYLLSGLPPKVHEAPSVEIEQGYLPGEQLRERVRRVRHAGGIDHKRTVKAGRGIRRIEVDEATTPEVFAAMWPLTEGARVLKRRYEVPDGDRVWEVDAFSDRELFLAEVELPSVDAEVTLPDWLAPYVEREVTDDPAYVNLNLAK